MLGDPGGVTTADLRSGPGFASIAEVLERDVRDTATGDLRAGVGIRGHAHRLFDMRWLRAADARFELVAVVSRPDRRPFHARACGETRLVYRLGYTTEVRSGRQQSRLPMTINVEFLATDDDEGRCAHAARLFAISERDSIEALAQHLRSDDGPLSPARVAPTRIAQVTVNLQAVRWPSAVRPDLGGHAEYVLRAFGRRDVDGTFEPLRLENTLDVARLRKDGSLRRDLVAWLQDPEHLRRIDEGTVRIPDRFLARRAVSITPRGFGRRGNRPASSALSLDDLGALDLSTYDRIRSPTALLRRLDELSCQGCHQSRSLAGFHQLGEDDADAEAGTAMVTGTSPHALADLDRRVRVAESWLRSEVADYRRPFAERAREEDGGYGAPCGLGDEGFRSWTCDTGLTCRPLDVTTDAQDEVGTCLPAEPEVGDPCEIALLVPNLDPRRDRAPRPEKTSCGPSLVCNTNAVGFPAGMCTATCASRLPHARCGSIAELAPFNACLARGEPISRCLTHVQPAGLRGCDRRTPCRSDYLCARTDGELGVCIPPYFLMQLRVDGHP